MKINKYGKVVIDEGDIVITGFEFDCQDGSSVHDCATLVLLWAIKRIVEKTFVELGCDK